MNTTVRQLHTPHISDEEWQVRTDLAALHRLYVKFGWTDLIYTHLTARSPENPDHYLIKPDDLLMEEVTASSLLKVDMEGNLITGDGPPNQAGHLIHTAVLGARPEINFSAHTHSRAGHQGATATSVLSDTLWRTSPRQWQTVLRELRPQRQLSRGLDAGLCS